MSRTAAPASRRSATRAASHMRPSSSRPENGSSSSSSGHPDWSASSSATRWSIPRLSVAAGRSRTAGSRPLAAAAVAQSVVVSPRSARIARSHSPQRNAGARRTFSGTKAHAAWRTSDPARGAARPARTRRRLVLPLPLAPATWTAAPGPTVRATPDSTVRRPRRIVSAPASSSTGTAPNLAPGRGHPSRDLRNLRVVRYVIEAWPRAASRSPSSSPPPCSAPAHPSPPPIRPGRRRPRCRAPAAAPRPRPRGATSRRSRRPTAPSRRARPPNCAAGPRGRRRPVEHGRRPRRRRGRAVRDGRDRRRRDLDRAVGDDRRPEPGTGGDDVGGGRRAHPAHALGHAGPERHRPRRQRPRRRRAVDPRPALAADLPAPQGDEHVQRGSSRSTSARTRATSRWR